MAILPISDAWTCRRFEMGIGKHRSQTNEPRDKFENQPEMPCPEHGIDKVFAGKNR